MQHAKTICEVVRDMESADQHGIVKLSKYVEFIQRERINTSFAYLNSKHLSGDKDYMGREKPFKQIIIPVRNVIYRSTDIDRKNITIGADSNVQVIPALMASIYFYQWMKKQNFGQYLNDWGLELSNHNAIISKFVEKGDELICKVMNWDKMIVDPIDFYANPQIEKIDFTPADLKKQKNYDKKVVEELLDNLTTRKTFEGQDKTGNSNYITVYEVHGEFPLSWLTDNEEDEDTYTQQTYHVCFEAKDGNSKEYNEYILYKGREKQSPYEIDYLIKQDGVTYPGGVVQELEQSQWMVNHYEKLLKDKLDAQKDIYQTADKSYLGKNATNDIENNDVLVHEDQRPLTKINTETNIAPLQSAGSGWMAVANLIGGINEAMISTPKAGTAWRSLQAQLQEAHSLFELMRENKGLALIKNLTKFVIPFFKKQLDNSDEIIGILEDYQIKQIDAMYLPAEINRRMDRKKKDTVLSGEIYTPEIKITNEQQVTQEVQGELQGNRRSISPSEIKDKTWKEVFKDLEWKVDIDVTGEGKDFEGNSETFKSILGFLANLQGRPMTPQEQLIFNKMLINTRIVSPLELSFTKSNQQPQQTPAPMAQPAMAG